MKTPFRLIVGMLLLAITDISAGTLYVSKASVNPAPPYATWATAATNIQDAVNTAVGGDIPIVTNGVYSGGLLVSNPLTILSANGPQFTSIDGGGTNRCIAVSSVTAMSGFTLTNGWALTDGGGVWSIATGAFLTNCILSGNCASNGGGAYEGVFLPLPPDRQLRVLNRGAATHTKNKKAQHGSWAFWSLMLI